MTKSVAIIGGGLIGLSTALMLSDHGADVTIVDRGALGGGSARGNAGFMCTTLLEPLAAPGAVKSAITSLRDPTRALRVHSRALPGMLGWGAHFARSATKTRYVAGCVSHRPDSRDWSNYWATAERLDRSDGSWGRLPTRRRSVEV